jgi:hypothetical protein
VNRFYTRLAPWSCFYCHSASSNKVLVKPAQTFFEIWQIPTNRPALLLTDKLKYVRGAENAFPSLILDSLEDDFFQQPSSLQRQMVRSISDE